MKKILLSVAMISIIGLYTLEVYAQSTDSFDNSKYLSSLSFGKEAIKSGYMSLY